MNGSLPFEGGCGRIPTRDCRRGGPEGARAGVEAELRAASPFRTAEALGVEEIIDPRDTRPILCEYIALAEERLRIGLGPRAKAGVAP